MGIRRLTYTGIVKYFAFRLINIGESRYEDVVYLERPPLPPPTSLARAVKSRDEVVSS